MEWKKGMVSRTITLPNPGVMINPSANFTPALIRGIKIHPDEPLRFDFIVDAGGSGLSAEDLRNEDWSISGKRITVEEAKVKCKELGYNYLGRIENKEEPNIWQKIIKWLKNIF